MRTNIDINDQLIAKAIKLSKSKTKKQVVELALESFIKSIMRRQMLELKGNINWEGDLKQMRTA